MNNIQPRYRQIADELRLLIASGRLKPGDALPTEMELCEAKDISRHTAREALRILTEDGLIARRRGAGTVVTTPPAPAFAQPIGDFESILQYARDAVFSPEKMRPATSAEMKRMGVDGSYITYTGLRRASGEAPLAVTTILVLNRLAPPMEELSHLNGSISEWIEGEHGAAVANVIQRMEAVALSKTDATRLGVKPDSPALRTLRRYIDTAGQTILVSESLHPAGRFAYEMKLTRQRK
ncbi:GntR family transcriptional regulator [Hyphomonas sp. WL0036]|uniref:GntR family transcriptional regulator n=1 Tax=Hyphomonas sediminis TaxID=2866160 RepID=UPI001C80A89C|nr:GntR family transcriptional regulator [Hyphomonas sediminis]MBY9066942.1 GntR family transcriptional regulator [Hyphomonas sediminis]